jgi:uncharacterized protein
VRVVQHETVFVAAVGAGNGDYFTTLEGAQERLPARIVKDEQVKTDIGIEDDARDKARGGNGYHGGNSNCTSIFMLIVLSPAKSLDLDTPSPTFDHTLPAFVDRAAQLIGVLRDLSPGQVGDLMHISDQLATLNVARYASWTREHADGYQAVMAFNGDVYAGLDARSLAPAALSFAQERLRILSGLYGLLRPLDLIHPYRLEMGTKLANPSGKDLYTFWGESITAALNTELARLGSGALVNLASEEYFKSVKPKLLAVPVITPVFEDWKNGKYKIISFYAKRARGMMARYAVEKGITDPEALKDFDVDGYAFVTEGSSERSWLFRRKEAA